MVLCAQYFGHFTPQILTGTVPYPTITGEIAVVIQILQVNSKPILEGGSNVPDQLRALLERCWERSQEHRVTISIVLQELYKIVSKGYGPASVVIHRRCFLFLAIVRRFRFGAETGYEGLHTTASERRDPFLFRVPCLLFGQAVFCRQ